MNWQFGGAPNMCVYDTRPQYPSLFNPFQCLKLSAVAAQVLSEERLINIHKLEIHRNYLIPGNCSTQKCFRPQGIRHLDQIS